MIVSYKITKYLAILQFFRPLFSIISYPELAYDMNPTLNEYQALLINSTTNYADLDVLLESSEEYMISKDEAKRIIDEVKAVVSQWKAIATRLGAAKREMEIFEQVYRKNQR